MLPRRWPAQSIVTLSVQQDVRISRDRPAAKGANRVQHIMRTQHPGAHQRYSPRAAYFTGAFVRFTLFVQGFQQQSNRWDASQLGQRHTGVANSSTREPAIQMPPHLPSLSPPRSSSRRCRSSNTGAEHDTGEATCKSTLRTEAAANTFVRCRRTGTSPRAYPRISSPSPEDLYRVNNIAYTDGQVHSSPPLHS